MNRRIPTLSLSGVTDPAVPHSASRLNANEFMLNRLIRFASVVRALGPYLAIELLMPGGSVVALSLWAIRHRSSHCTSQAAKSYQAPQHLALGGIVREVSPHCAYWQIGSPQFHGVPSRVRSGTESAAAAVLRRTTIQRPGSPRA